MSLRSINGLSVGDIAAIVLGILVGALVIALAVSVSVLSSKKTPDNVGTFIQQGEKLVGVPKSGGQQGTSTAISADGNTIVSGATFDSSLIGCAFVFERSGSKWKQTAKLVGTGASSNTVQQGFSVAISGDGNTIAMSSNVDSANIGATWIFVRSGSSWVQQGPKLVGGGIAGSTSQQGQSLSLANDGNTLAIGGITDNNNIGAVWIFVRSGSTWSQQGNKLVGSGTVGPTIFQGFSVSLSADGNSLAVGGPIDNSGAGAVWIWTRTGNIWSQYGSKLVGTGATGPSSQQGLSVALSGDGKSLIESGSSDNSLVGAFWYFKLVAGTWAQKNSPIVGPTTGSNSQFGTRLGINFDGTVAVIGMLITNPAFGAAYVFKNVADVWTYSQLLTGYDSNFSNTSFGTSVAIDKLGQTITVGGPFDDVSNDGANWVFALVKA